MSYSSYIYEKIAIAGNKTLALYGFRGDINSVPLDMFCRNVELLNEDGSMLWKIASHPQNDTNFVGLITKEGGIEVINAYGVAYRLKIETGEIVTLDWRK